MSIHLQRFLQLWRFIRVMLLKKPTWVKISFGLLHQLLEIISSLNLTSLSMWKGKCFHDKTKLLLNGVLKWGWNYNKSTSFINNCSWHPIEWLVCLLDFFCQMFGILGKTKPHRLFRIKIAQLLFVPFWNAYCKFGSVQCHFSSCKEKLVQETILYC